MESNLSSCCKFTKFLFIFFNILFFLIGAAALGVGIWAQVSKEFTEQINSLLLDTLKLNQDTINHILEPETVDNAAILIIVGGAIVMVLGFLGCFGGLKESQCLLVTFFLSMFLILGVVVAGAILIIAFPQTIEANFKPQITKLFNAWTDNGNANQTIDFIQEGLKCCGVDGPEDYTKENKTVPASCKEGASGSQSIYKIGCMEAFKDKINELLTSRPWIVGGVGIGVLAILVIGMILSCCLFCAVRKADQDVY